MSIKLKNNLLFIFLCIINVFNYKILANAFLMANLAKIDQTNIKHIDRFVTIISLLVIIGSFIITLIQAIFCKLILMMFNFAAELSILRNMTHLLKGTLPLFIISLTYTFLGSTDDLYNFINDPLVKYINLIIINIIYVFFVAKDLKLSLKQAVILGTTFTILNGVPLFIASYFV